VLYLSRREARISSDGPWVTRSSICDTPLSLFATDISVKVTALPVYEWPQL
jgi:hypothetical protein